jgi:peptidoglycan/LPS O-acetylase OafA/YrhL
MLELLPEIVRGLAAMWVFAYHIRPSANGIWFAASVGDFGVTAFFVISGYCILSAAQKTRARAQSAFSFLKRRLVRIYPPFWASIAVIIAVPFIISAITHETPHPLWYAYNWSDWLLVFSLGRIFFGHGKPLFTTFLNINAVYWSLAIEVQFYLVMFAALAWRRHFNRILIGTTALSLVTLAFPDLIRTGIFLSWWPLFAAGMGLKLLLDRFPAPRFNKAGLATALSLTAAIAASNAVAPNLLPEMFYPLTFAIASALSLWLAAPLDRRIPRDLVRPFLWLGSMSYSIYLLHTLVSQIPAAILETRMTPDGTPLKLLVMLITLAPAYAFYRIFEVHFMSKRRVEEPQPVEIPDMVFEFATSGD